MCHVKADALIWSHSLLMGDDSWAWGWLRAESHGFGPCLLFYRQSPAFIKTKMFQKCFFNFTDRLEWWGLRLLFACKKVKVSESKGWHGRCLNHAVQPEILPSHRIPVLFVRRWHSVMSSALISTLRPWCTMGSFMGPGSGKHSF